MATTYPRLGVSRDPELDRALAQTRRLLGEKETRSAAAQVAARPAGSLPAPPRTLVFEARTRTPA